MAGKDVKKPNVVFILSDDQGYWSMGCAGNNEIRTPNLDRLAGMGIRFTNFFCASPVCSPARASILTGRIPSQHGIHDWISGGNVPSDKLSQNLASKWGNPGLEWIADQIGNETGPIQYLEGQLAYTEILAANGYKCGLSGKWHMGDSITPQKGFTYWNVLALGGGSYYNQAVIRNGEVDVENKYITDYITENAIKFLDMCQDNSEPFYLDIHYTAPHGPWDRNEHPEDIYNSYDDCPFDSVPNEPIHPWAPKWTERYLEDGKRRDALKGYFAAVTAMDRGIGAVLDKLEEMGIRENTLVIFTSDNGMSMGHHGIWGKGNGTFPMNMYDTAVKVPMIISHPGQIPQGIVCDELLSHYDIMPTLIEYLGMHNPEEEKLPGRSFYPLLSGEGKSGTNAVVVFDEYGPVRMIRTKEWKYVHRYPYGPHELYDLVNDPGETGNLIDCEDKQEILASLKALLEDWFARYVNPLFDGTHEGVKGAGQINLAGPGGHGKKAYI